MESNKDIFAPYRRNKIPIELSEGTLYLNVMNPTSVQGIINKITKFKDEEFILGIVDTFKPIILENYPTIEAEVVEHMILCNAIDLFKSFQIAYGLAKKESLEENERKIQEKILAKVESKKDKEE